MPRVTANTTYWDSWYCHGWGAIKQWMNRTAIHKWLVRVINESLALKILTYEGKVNDWRNESQSDQQGEHRCFVQSWFNLINAAKSVGGIMSDYVEINFYFFCWSILQLSTFLAKNLPFLPSFFATMLTERWTNSQICISASLHLCIFLH